MLATMTDDRDTEQDPLARAWEQDRRARESTSWWNGIGDLAAEVRRANHFRQTWEKGRRRQDDRRAGNGSADVR